MQLSSRMQRVQCNPKKAVYFTPERDDSFSSRCVGHIVSLSFLNSDRKLKQDFFVSNPINPEKNDAIVAVIETILWDKSLSDSIEIDGRISFENQALIREILLSDENPKIALEWVVYDYDATKKKYFKKFYTHGPLHSYVNRLDSRRNYREGDLKEPMSFSFSCILTVQNTEQTLGFTFRADGTEYTRPIGQYCANAEDPTYIPSPLINDECDADKAYSFDKPLSTNPMMIGHLVSLSFPSLNKALAPDLALVNPENPITKNSIVGIVNYVHWESYPSHYLPTSHRVDNFSFGVYISFENKALMQEILAELIDDQVLAEWVVYDYDLGKKNYFQRFYSLQRPVFFKMQNHFVTVDDEPRHLANELELYTISLPLTVSRAQEVGVSFSVGGEHLICTVRSEDSTPSIEEERELFSITIGD